MNNSCGMLLQANLIGGHLSMADTDASIAVTNPATGAELGHVPNCGSAETNRAIAAETEAAQDVPEAVREITGGGAQVSLEALGISQTTNASVECLATLGPQVHVGMPAGDDRMEIDTRAIYSKQPAFFGTRGMPASKYPSLLSMIKRGDVDVTPMLDRVVPLSAASTELRAMKGPTRPGTAVITDFSQ